VIYTWTFIIGAIRRSDDVLEPDTARKLVGCSKADRTLYRPAQEAGMEEDPVARWHRSPAGQYWRELHDKYPGDFDSIIKLHDERYPDDGGPPAKTPK
jgi:hypothetical protein